MPLGLTPGLTPRVTVAQARGQGLDHTGAAQMQDRVGQAQGHPRAGAGGEERAVPPGQSLEARRCHWQAMLLGCGKGFGSEVSRGALGLAQSLWSSQAVGG